MTSPRILSDQLFTWSDRRGRKIHIRVEKAPPGTSAQTSLPDRHPARLSYRTLQALWQAGLQMREGSWSRPQVLPVCELSPYTPANGVRTARVLPADQEVSYELSARSRDLRRDLRDQSRTAAQARGALRNPDERNVFLAHRHHRSEIGRRPPRQYARDLARGPSGLPDDHGGDR
jgi:hypothetical protein